MSPHRYRHGSLGTFLILPLVLILASACGTNVVTGPPPRVASFVVVDSAGFPVAGATVYLVPAEDIDDAPIDGEDIRSGDSEDRDEPLEDAVRLNGATYQQAVTRASGHATIPAPARGRYFYFVQPAVGDTEHLPGGSGCRLALEWTVFENREIEVVLSSQPGASATYLGTSTCLGCHSEYATQTNHAHRLGFAVPGQFSGLQDASRYPTFEENWQQYLPAASYTGGTAIYLSDFDPSRGFDKFKTSLTDPTPDGETVYVIAWLWRDTGDDKYKITLENMRGPDARSPWTMEVALTYGGAVYKQRNLVRVPGRKGLYPLLQYQDQGNDDRYQRTRRQFRDYHLDWFWDAANDVFKDPPLNKNFEANCTACHATGFVRYQDQDTSEWLTDAVDDSQGAYDIDGDGRTDEVNIGCEVCHGPGSDHLSWVIDPDSSGHKSRYIVTPQNLSPSREMMICGRCHGREMGNGSIPNDEPLNSDNEMLPVGGSRHEYLTAGYVQRKGPAASSMWSDDIHSKSHHQQYSDLLKSTKYRNGRVITTCANCHDSHGTGEFTHHLRKDPNDTSSRGLCANCHLFDVISHMLEKTGNTHTGRSTGCAECHVANTAKTGAGVLGQLLAPPTGTAADDDTVYYQNDISSHLFLRIPKKTHPDVAGEQPVNAMPIPYTLRCGEPCHDASSLPQSKLGPIVDPFEAGMKPREPAHEDDDYGSR